MHNQFRNSSLLSVAELDSVVMLLPKVCTILLIHSLRIWARRLSNETCSIQLPNDVICHRIEDNLGEIVDVLIEVWDFNR